VATAGRQVFRVILPNRSRAAPAFAMIGAMTALMDGAVPGWYPDPEDPTRVRRWDGRGWTDSWMSAGGGAGAVQAPRFSDPGWHDDPMAGGKVRQRWWDGQQWTDRLRHGRAYPPRPRLPRWFFAAAGVLRAVLLVNGLVAAASFGMGLWTLSLVDQALNGAGYGVDEANAYDTLDAVVPLVQFGVYVLAGVVFVAWLWSAYRCDRVDPRLLAHGSGWAVGVWFVPVLNLVRPYRLVADLRAGIRSGLGDERPDPRPRSVAWWWAAFLLMLVTDFAVALAANGLDEPDQLAFLRAWRTEGWVRITDALVTAVAAYLAYALVTRLTAGLRRPEFRDVDTSTARG